MDSENAKAGPEVVVPAEVVDAEAEVGAFPKWYPNLQEPEALESFP